MNYSVINLKTNPDLKKQAAKTAKKLGVSISTLLNNELRRFVAEQSVLLETPEVLNAETAKQLKKSRKDIESGNYHSFDSNKQALDYLDKEL